MSDKLNTMLTSPFGYNTSKLVFSKPQKSTLTNPNPNAAPIEYTRINIRTVNSDGSIGELVFPTEECYSYGVSENISQETGNVSGHTMPLCLWSRDRDTGKASPTENEKKWTDNFDNVVEAIKDYIIREKDNFDKFADFEESEIRILLKKFNPLYWKRDKGRVVDGTGPTLYAKLIETKKKEQGIITKFYDYSGTQLDPLSLLKCPCRVRGAIKIESIFIGKDCSLQVKLYEADVNVIESQISKRLLPKMKPEGKLLPMGEVSDNQSYEMNVNKPLKNLVKGLVESENSATNTQDDETSSIISETPALPTPSSKEKRPTTRRTMNKTS